MVRFAQSNYSSLPYRISEAGEWAKPGVSEQLARAFVKSELRLQHRFFTLFTKAGNTVRTFKTTCGLLPSCVRLAPEGLLSK